MKRIVIKNELIFVLCMTMFSACGGGGNSTSIVSQPPVSAVLTLGTSITSSLPANTTINGYDVIVTLPAGVTVKTMPLSSGTGTGVVSASGKASGAFIVGAYTAATGTFPGTVKVWIASATGFDAGEFSTVQCDIAAGYSPSRSDFQQPTFVASGLVTSPSTSTIDVTGYLYLTELVALY